MPSKLAEELADYMRVQSSHPASVNAVDRRLAEVREVLDGLQSLGQKNCWCRFTSNKEHSISCQRTQRLYERLNPDGPRR